MKEEEVKEEEKKEKEEEIVDKVFIVNGFPNYVEYGRLERFNRFNMVVFNYEKEEKEDKVDYSLLEKMEVTEEELRERLGKFIEENLREGGEKGEQG